MNMSGRPAIYVIGSVNTDMVVKADRLPKPGQTVSGGDFFTSAGGKGGNQAVAAARLGANVRMVANLGEDVFGDAAVKRLEAESVDTTHVSRDENQPSGVALISVDAQGENQIVVAPGANATLLEAQVDRAFETLPEGSLVLMQLEVPLPTVIHAVAVAGEKGCRVILDPAPARALPGDLLAGVFLLTPNETEAEALTGIDVHDEASALEAARELRDAGVPNVAITLGGEGVLLATAEDSEFIPAPEVSAVDTTAAGDCFNGSLAVGLAAGKSLREATAFACRAAAISVTRLGAQDSMPFEGEVE